ncbi:MAG: cation transporter [Iamia sp.]
MPTQAALVRRGRHLSWITIAWSSTIGLVGLIEGVRSGSLALVAFGLDAGVAVVAASVVLWRLDAARQGASEGARAEPRAARIVAISLLVLAAAISAEALRRLVLAHRPDPTAVGIVLAAASIPVLTFLARVKHRLGDRLGSRAVLTDAAETALGAGLAALLLVGLVAQSTVGWWWADPLAALGVAAVALRKGLRQLSPTTAISAR